MSLDKAEIDKYNTLSIDDQDDLMDKLYDADLSWVDMLTKVIKESSLTPVEADYMLYHLIDDAADDDDFEDSLDKVYREIMQKDFEL